jgi:hypothetical protein
MILKLLKNHSIFRHASVAATTIIRKGSSCKLNTAVIKQCKICGRSKSKTYQRVQDKEFYNGGVSAYKMNLS